MDCDQARRDMGRFLDGELHGGPAAEPGLAAELEEHLRACAACAALADRQRALAHELRQVIPLAAPGALRERLRAQATAEVAPPASPSAQAPSARLAPLRVVSRDPFRLAAAVAAALLIAWFAARWWYLPTPRELLVHDLVAAHVRSLLPGHLTDVQSSDHHTVKPWFTGRLDYSPWVEDLAARGFPLVGGRVDYVAGERVAVLVYQRGPHLIDLVVRPLGPGGEGPSLVTGEGYLLRSWTRQGQAFTAISDLNATELEAFAGAVQEVGP